MTGGIMAISIKKFESGKDNYRAEKRPFLPMNLEMRT
jgi:hypothetical protein